MDFPTETADVVDIVGGIRILSFAQRLLRLRFLLIVSSLSESVTCTWLSGVCGFISVGVNLLAIIFAFKYPTLCRKIV